MNLNLKGKFAISKKDFIELFRFEQSAESPIKIRLWIIGALISPLAVAGALFGYARAYNKFLKEDGYRADLSILTPIVRVSMIVFGFIGFMIGNVIFYILIQLFLNIMGAERSPLLLAIILGVVPFVLLETYLIKLSFRIFYKWQIGINNMLIESDKFGSARFAQTKELLPYTNKQGIYIGGGYTFSEKGHILTKASTRSGKGATCILPNLLGLSGYIGSWVVIDFKGENAAISARYQRERGQKVVVLNPFELLEKEIGEAQCFNPLDMLSDKTSLNFIDDIGILAEQIVPIKKTEHDSFFTDNARSIVAGLLLYLMTAGEKETQVLSTLWKWVRYTKDAWNNLLADMATCEDETNGEAIRNAASEILKLMEAGDKTYGSIIATVLQETDFLKSPALQKSMQSGYDPSELSEGKTTLYIVLPVDKVKSQPKWLRLVVTSLMRAVVRKPNKKVTFLLDEMPVMGYNSEIETALGTYAGFNITVWAIVQNLTQLKNVYSDNWENFISNCTIRQYFSVKDVFSAEYISKAMGKASHVIFKRRWFGISDAQANPRDLLTPDEIMRGSKDNVFAFFGDLPPTFFPKLPYYQMGALIDNGAPRYDDNPYFKDK